ncbi:site-specific integrase [Microbacterium sp. KUDC0406]|nr:site-specific integrase [Microbacterium sp. KUDC0406]
MLARLGLRPGEALELQVEDFDETSASLSVPGWGGHRRRVLVDDRQILLRLSNYIRYTANPAGPLFTARGRDTPLRYQSVQHRWGQYCAEAGVVLQLSELRQAHAAELLAGGVPEHVVRERLGQRSGALGAAVSFSAADSDAALTAWHERREAEVASAGVSEKFRGHAG